MNGPGLPAIHGANVQPFFPGLGIRIDNVGNCGDVVPRLDGYVEVEASLQPPYLCCFAGSTIWAPVKSGATRPNAWPARTSLYRHS